MYNIGLMESVLFVFIFIIQASESQHLETLKHEQVLVWVTCSFLLTTSSRYSWKAEKETYGATLTQPASAKSVLSP